MAVELPPAADKAAVVEAMFDRIAPRYDLLNRLLTFRLDRRWRARAVELAAVGPADTVLDLGCGTGDMCQLAAAAGARVTGVDFAARMLDGLRRRGIHAHVLRSDAACLPIRDGAVTVVASAFALRNFVSIPAVLAEAARVASDGARLVLLEVDEPDRPLSRWGHAAYFRHVVPFVGGLLSDRFAYRYLPRSTVYLPPEKEMLQLLREAGWRDAVKHRLSGGIAQLILAHRARTH
jgi:demethylmenaquinone methyltransferase / 2-methoxy-6-polyprenyl-1,4-benzoquinol methylase